MGQKRSNRYYYQDVNASSGSHCFTSRGKKFAFIGGRWQHDTGGEKGNVGMLEIRGCLQGIFQGGTFPEICLNLEKKMKAFS